MKPEIDPKLEQELKVVSDESTGEHSATKDATQVPEINDLVKQQKMEKLLREFLGQVEVRKEEHVETYGDQGASTELITPVPCFQQVMEKYKYDERDSKELLLDLNRGGLQDGIQTSLAKANITQKREKHTD